jgi:hypothetical protein
MSACFRGGGIWGFTETIVEGDVIKSDVPILLGSLLVTATSCWQDTKVKKKIKESVLTNLHIICKATPYGSVTPTHSIKELSSANL